MDLTFVILSLALMFVADRLLLLIGSLIQKLELLRMKNC